MSSSPDTSPTETPRAAALCDGRFGKLEAVVVAVDTTKDQPGNSIISC